MDTATLIRNLWIQTLLIDALFITLIVIGVTVALLIFRDWDRRIREDS